MNAEGFTKVALSVALGSMVAVLCEIGDSAAAVHVVKLVGPHLDGKVAERMHDYILKNSPDGPKQ